jgi:hypothetical protein
VSTFADDHFANAAFTDGRHHEAAVEEWVFATWTSDAKLGVISGHRLVGRTAWYWAALARKNRPLLHITDFEVPVRNVDPFIVKGEQLWAEHTRDAPMEQWTVGNETYASSLENPDDALGRAYGAPTPVAFDLEWYAVGAATEMAASGSEVGYEQRGVVHGQIEIHGEDSVVLGEVPAHRWHRWTVDPGGSFGPLALPEAIAHTAVRAPFAFPNGSISDLVLTPTGWNQRRRQR